jgi:acyl-ACP thioesterase
MLVPVPDEGRVFTAQRRVRLADVSPGGRVRFDALARYLQDVSSDDTADARLAGDMAWVVRRTLVEVHVAAVYREELTLRTFCSGTGSRWAERRIAITGEHGAHIEAASLWVFVDAESGRPARLPPQFHELFGPTAAGREVSARLRHPRPPQGAPREPWPLRYTDFDVLGHVNNAAYWAAVEEQLARRRDRRDLRRRVRAEVEFGAGVERDHEIDVIAVDEPDGALSAWLVSGTTVAASAVVRPLDG